MRAYGFIRRQAPKKHVCKLPAFRWLPWIVVPRWRIGAQYRCTCNTVYEWQNRHVSSFHDYPVGTWWEIEDPAKTRAREKNRAAANNWPSPPVFPA